MRRVGIKQFHVHRVLARLAEEGWVVVPKEPEPNLFVQAATKIGMGGTPLTVEAGYRAMLAAIDGKEKG